MTELELHRDQLRADIEEAHRALEEAHSAQGGAPARELLLELHALTEELAALTRQQLDVATELVEKRFALRDLEAEQTAASARLAELSRQR